MSPVANDAVIVSQKNFDMKMYAAGGFFLFRYTGGSEVRPGRLLLSKMIAVDDDNWRVYASLKTAYSDVRDKYALLKDLTIEGNANGNLRGDEFPQSPSEPWFVMDIDYRLRLWADRVWEAGKLFRALALPPKRFTFSGNGPYSEYWEYEFRDKFISVFGKD